jgi:hypothetical protein
MGTNLGFVDVSTTISGEECLNWQETLFSELMDHNYCANPDRDESGPWCFLSDQDNLWEVISKYLIKQIILFHF